jgi:hypothetical protein
MTCETAIDLVVDSLMDRLEARQRAELETHLAGCATCAAEADEMRSLWRGLEAVETPAPSGETFIRFGRQLERRRRKALPLGLRVAAAAGLLLGGALFGRLTTNGTEPAGRDLDAPSQSYLLVIRGAVANRESPGTPLLPAYLAWERDLESEGILVAAEKLSDDGGEWVRDQPLSAADPSTLALRGFFLIRAASYDEAVSVARQSPHIAFGGTIEVREIEKE